MHVSPIEYAWCQFKMTSSKCPYRSKHQVIILTVYIYLVHHTKQARNAFHHTNIHRPKFYKASRRKSPQFTNHHRNVVNMEDLERRVFAKASCSTDTAWLLWRSHSLDKLLAFCQHTNNHHPKFWRWFAVVCSGLRWFACLPLFSLHIVQNSGGDLWWFAVVCGRLRWFGVVCDGLSYSYSHTPSLEDHFIKFIPIYDRK